MAFKTVAPVASHAGISLEETTAAIGLLANAGIQGEQGGTALRGAIAALADASGPAQEELNRLGINAMNADGSMRPLVDIVRDFEGAGLDMATAIKIFGVEAAPGFLAMVDQGSDALEGFTGELENSEDAAKDMAAIKMEGLAGQLKTLRSAADNAMLAFADMGLLTGATKVVEFLAAGVQKLTSFMEDHGEKIKPVVQMSAFHTEPIVLAHPRARTHTSITNIEMIENIDPELRKRTETIVRQLGKIVRTLMDQSSQQSSHSRLTYKRTSGTVFSIISIVSECIARTRVHAREKFLDAASHLTKESRSHQSSQSSHALSSTHEAQADFTLPEP